MRRSNVLTSHRLRRRAFASFSAVVLVGTTAIALTALARVTTHDVRRANHAAADAQLRQLLLAGQAFVETQTVKANERNHIDVPLPSELGSNSALRIRYQREGVDASLSVTIEATHRQRYASVVLVEGGEGEWQATDVQMP